MAKFESRDLVIPGDLLFEGRTRIGDNTYRREGRVYASRIGLVNYGKNQVSVIALEAGFNPLVGDIVIGEIMDIELGKWIVEIGAPITAELNTPDAIDQPFNSYMVMPDILDIGDTIAAKIVDLDRKRTPILSILGDGLGKVTKGFIMYITPSKIPRLIGKKGSMINMILRETQAKVTIGQNGRILVSGKSRDQEEIVVKVIRKIEKEAHTSGLTNKIQGYLEKLKEEIN